MAKKPQIARPERMAMQSTDLHTSSFDHVRRMSTGELANTIAKCEDAIANGSARIEDYEAFVLCQKELARRTWA